MSPKLHRRRFIQSSAVGLGYWFTAPAASAQRASKAPNGSIHIAGVGIGGKGDSDIDQASDHGQVVAICDIDEHRLDKKGQKFTSAKKYFDFRKMFDEMARNIDAVVVSTPDHTHAPASMMAMKLKKHVYCQKPLTHTVFEARKMRETAAEMGVATQMGNQGTALNGLRRAVEIVQSGLIGQVHEVHVWTNRPVWPQAPKIMAIPPEAPIPSHVHWEEFIGPAPMRTNGTYEEVDKEKKVQVKSYFHPFNWRGWWDFGTGALGDMACHTANMAFMALKLRDPISVVADVVVDLNKETYPAGARVVFQFGQRGSMSPVKFTWYEGKQNGKKLVPPEELTKRAIALDKKRNKLVDSGTLLVGDKGMIYSPSDYGAEVFFDPPEKFVGVNTEKPEKLPMGTDTKHFDHRMKEEWFEAIKGGPPASSNFDYAGRLTETILLGNIAMRLQGQQLNWDAEKLRFTNNNAANQFVSKEYRAGWSI